MLPRNSSRRNEMAAANSAIVLVEEDTVSGSMMLIGVVGQIERSNGAMAADDLTDSIDRYAELCRILRARDTLGLPGDAWKAMRKLGSDWEEYWARYGYHMPRGGFHPLRARVYRFHALPAYDVGDVIKVGMVPTFGHHLPREHVGR